MTWVIEMPESRRERRMYNDGNLEKEAYASSNSSNHRYLSKEHTSPLSILLVALGVIGVLLLIYSISTGEYGGISFYISIVLLSFSIFLIFFMLIYRNLNSIKNYLRSIDEKLDQ